MALQPKRPVIAATTLIAVTLLLAPVICEASTEFDLHMEILVNGSPVREYGSRNTTYIEALKNTEYAVRLRNTTGRRIAVALSVDGLNSIDAKTTTAHRAAKWVLGPYETVVIEGWQTNQQHARKFFFTTEEASYGAWLGKTANLGVIEAVVFRERMARERIADASAQKRQAPRSAGATAPAPSGVEQESAAGKSSDDFAATGIGRQVENPVRKVSLDLESSPSAHLRVRYEYRPQLVALGVLPAISPDLNRRELAQGFDDFEFCPVPGASR